MATFDFDDFPDTSISPLETIGSAVIATVFPDAVSFTLEELDVDGDTVEADFRLQQNTYEYTFTGTGLVEQGNRLVAGTLDAFDFVFNDIDVAEADNLGIDVASLIDANTPDVMPFAILDDVVDIGWNVTGTEGDDIFGNEPFTLIPGTSVTPDGNDSVAGGGGNDIFFLAGGDDVGRGNRGADSISGGNGADRLFGGGGSDTLLGGRGGDLLVGGGGDDELRGGGGFDVARGRGGNDRIFGNNGEDVLNGNNGNDLLVGGARSDVLRGGNGDDVMRGNGGRDVLVGGRGEDRMNGGALSDTMRGGGQSDVMLGARGADRIVGNNGNDRLVGGSGADQLFGGRGADTLNGGRGNDVLDGGRGRDTFVFSDGGRDRITDFSTRRDTLDLTRVDDVQDAVDRPAGALIRFDGGQVLVLGVDADDLTFLV